MRQRPQAPIGDQLLHQRDLRLIAHRQWHRRKAAGRARFVGDAAYFFGVESHRFFHQERIAVVEQMVRDASHLRRPAERKHEIRFHLAQHLHIVGEDGGITHLRSALGCNRSVGIVQREDAHIGHFVQQGQVRRIV